MAISFSYVKPLPLASGLTVLVVGVQVSEYDAGQASFEGAQGFGGGISFGKAVVVGGPSDAFETDLGDRDAATNFGGTPTTCWPQVTFHRA